MNVALGIYYSLLIYLFSEWKRFHGIYFSWNQFFCYFLRFDVECQTETRLANRQQCDPYEEEACQEIPDEQCSEVDEEKCEIISKAVEEEVCSDVPGESCSQVTDEECEIIEEV